MAVFLMLSIARRTHGGIGAFAKGDKSPEREVCTFSVMRLLPYSSKGLRCMVGLDAAAKTYSIGLNETQHSGGVNLSWPKGGRHQI